MQVVNVFLYVDKLACLNLWVKIVAEGLDGRLDNDVILLGKTNFVVRGGPFHVIGLGYER